MKKTVFLFMLVVIAIFNLTNGVHTQGKVFEIDDYEIIVTNFKEDRSSGFTVEKTGVNPFVATVIDYEKYYYISGVTIIEDYYILYGYGFTLDTDTEYDAFFIVFDTAGNIIKKDLRDYGSMETVKSIFYIDNIFITYIEQTIDLDYSYLFEASHFSSYDLNFNYVDSIELGSQIRRLSYNDKYILVGYTSSPNYDFGIRSDLTTLNDDEEIDLTEGEVYIGEVEIEFINGATLNNEYVENGLSISYPGEYVFIYNDKIYNFTVEPIITGVEDDVIYEVSVTPRINSGNIILNNDLFVSDTEITSPGNYSLIVTGANNYTTELSFTITSNLEGIINNNSYTDPVVLTFNGEGYLNNQYIDSPYEVSEDGEYILKINGENNYLETYFFSIEKIEEETRFIDFVQRVDILVLVVVLVSGGIILKKK